MTFLVEWWLTVHRVVWFPVLWATGLDQPGMEVEDYKLPDEPPVSLAATRTRQHALAPRDHSRCVTWSRILESRPK